MPIALDRTAEWVLLLVQLPGLPPAPAGILLLDPGNDELHIALSDSVSMDEGIKEFWDALREDLPRRASLMGGARLLASLEDDLSLFLQLEVPRNRLSTTDPKQTLAALFAQHVLNSRANKHASR